jgi:DNA-binding NtrC family response regulator
MSELIAKSAKTNILVVDDEEPVCQSVQKILSRKGYEVESALCASTALDQLKQGRTFDLIITDLMMPQVGGVELVKIVKDSWPTTRVLMITGYASIASAVEATRLGAVDYIPKPFTPEELEEAVESALTGAVPAVAEAQAKADEEVIDVDMPFSATEVAQATSESYVEHLTRSDVLAAQPAAPAVAPDYCAKGDRNCKRFVRRGVCAQEECPVVVAERKKAERQMSFSSLIADAIDVDMPFSFSEVAEATSESYALALGPSDMPVIGHWQKATVEAEAPRVLVVDDEAVVVNSIRKTLARHGYRIDEVFNGRDALNLVKNEEFDLVLLDMKLPDINGLDLLPTLKQLRPDMPVLIVTGYASIDTAVEAIRRGADDYMPKPFTPEELHTFASRYVA